MAPKKNQQQAVNQAVRQAANSGGKINQKEYNQILKIAGDATAAAKAIVSSGAQVGGRVQNTFDQVAATYDPATKGGAGLGMVDARYLQSLGVSKDAIKEAGANADYVSKNFYNNYRTGTTGEVRQIQAWQQSVNDQNQLLINSINDQITANSNQQNQYLPLIESLTAQLADLANKQTELQGSTGAYAIGATQSAPAQGAKTTSAIGARRKPLNSSLTISPAASVGAGAGLNIAA